jgi:hypothetical protein
MWGSVIPTVSFSLAALILSIFCFTGCDFIRLTFGAEDKELYFPNDEYFGLGLFRHQDFSTNKSALSWQHDSTCYDYTEFEEGIFHDSNVKTASLMFIISVALSAATLLALLILQFRGNGIQRFSIMAITALMSSSAAILQELVFFDMFKASGDAVCNDELYGAAKDGDVEAWLLSYPAKDYPNLAYMRFFSNCKIGTTGKIAMAGFIAQFIATLLIVMNHFFAPDEITSSSPKGNKLNEASAPPVSKGDEEESSGLGYENNPTPQSPPDKEFIDESPSSFTKEIAPESDVGYANNPLGPLAQAAPQSSPDEEFIDDISYDHTDKEDNIMFEDDLSMAASTDHDISPINPESSLMSRKALSSGRF